MLLYGMGHSFLGSETRTVDKSGSQLIYTLYLAPAAPQIRKLFCTQRQIPNGLKRPRDLLSSAEKNLSTPTLINNHYRLLLSQFLDTMNVGPKGRSGDAQPHPRALCHTLGNPVPVPPKLGPGGLVGGFCWVSYQTKG